MEKWWLNSMFFNQDLERRCVLSASLGPIGNTSGSEEPTLNDNDNEKTMSSWSDRGSSSYSNLDYLLDFDDPKEICNLISDDTLWVRDSNGDSYSVYFDIENNIFEIDTNSYFLGELESLFSSYLNLNSGSKSYNGDSDDYVYDTRHSWKNHINSSIDSYIRSETNTNLDSCILNGNNNYSDNYIYSYICNDSESESDLESSNLQIQNNVSDTDSEIQNDLDRNQKYRHLWVQCENCYGLNYKKFFSSKMNICEQCGYHLKMCSSDRIALLVDPDTWDPMDENMVSIDPIEFHSEEEPYRDRIYSYQIETGLAEAVQTGTGKLNGIPIAIGVMDFKFMGGSMGSVVGEKITRLIEYATDRSLPVIMVCASGGARMQEGSLSLMQMAKISSALYNYQSNKKLFYVSILTSPTTGGVTASFGMLGDIIIAEPNAYIAFAGKRVIEQTLKKTVPEGSQVAEYLFQKGLFDLMVPRNLLKGVLSELFQLHGFLPPPSI
uniref:Acetyl-coenzyme A carboxylase carboxyl transferase subunit beta, chloroplastic n=1 Tax=Cabomba caroliniana TaxID=4426 RepID=A0A1D6YJS4_CABCA|nr:acetyl-CoA carboxylase beta subunit [Cabomba caroliniana]ANA10740.1 acetyl-CoA carboxylase beta subunit [Cabomba caroliniana]AUD56495.1 AccD [Cabomba caroliniana]AYE67866.1 acetyl-CoA carboxylase beta subunit [Cabomba caroliniana]